MDGFADTTPVRTDGGQPPDAIVGGGRADAADLRPAIDGSGAVVALVIDDFSDDDQSTNSIGGPVVSDNQILVPPTASSAFSGEAMASTKT